MRVEASTVIERPAAVVWQFYAVDHVGNHPRWDPEMALEKVGDGPIGIGTVIRRRNSHGPVPVEGSMEVVEFSPERAMRVVTSEAGRETYGFATMESVATDRTKLTIGADIPWMDDSTDTGPLAGLIARSAANIKQLIESET